MKFLAFFFMLATFAIAAPVAISSSKHFRPSVQQSEHLKIKENMIATHDMVLYIVIHDTGLERGQILLRHDHIDVNPKDRWLEDILMLVAKGGHFPIADGFVVDGRRNVGNLKRPLYSARNHCIRRAIESMMEHHNYHQYSLAPSPRGRFGGL
ncbi:hypothetical protein N7530_008612 [Penicillium desertorum]|uniref:Uncharacterized protein n=1 Tax=Penicillium desertorum TaxID=1303715 RepID=A0A9W9WPG0_9EURO|nr:hypothetical protein N7530_008612 [Penicillium desertorum]